MMLKLSRIVKYEVRSMRYEKDLRERSLEFAIKIIMFCNSLIKNDTNRILLNQIIRSATSIGANLEEAKGSRTKAEFVNSTNIAKKEARETYYWLKIISAVNTKNAKAQELLNEAGELIAILTSSVKKLTEK